MIKIDNISYIYEDGTEALRKQSFDFNKGEIIGIIGANGAGKSTLFLNIMGILKPTSGEIYFNDKKLQYKKKSLREFRKKVGLVFQDPDKQIFYSNIYDDIAFSLRNLGVGEKEVEERVIAALKDVDGLDFIEKPVHFLSMGQKKRVAIAGTLVLDQDVVLFDEPTAGLDPVMTEEIIRILAKLKSKGKKVIVSSHNMDLIYRICDYVYILAKGAVISEGKTQEVFLDREALEEASLNEPWMVKVHREGGTPLFSDEKELFEYLRRKK